MFPFKDRKFSYKHSCFQKTFWNCSSAYKGYDFGNHALLFCWKSKFFSPKSENDRITVFLRLVLPRFFSLRTWIGVLPHLTKEFCKTTKKNWSTSRNDTKRIKVFRKRNHFSSKNFSGSAISCCKNREKIFFLTKGPTFFMSKSEGGWNILHFFKKILSSKPPKGTSAAVLITMPVIVRWEFSLKPWKKIKKMVFFFLLK